MPVPDSCASLRTALTAAARSLTDHPREAAAALAALHLGTDLGAALLDIDHEEAETARAKACLVLRALILHGGGAPLAVSVAGIAPDATAVTWDHHAAQRLELARVEVAAGGRIDLDESDRVTRRDAVARFGREPDGRGWGGEFWRDASGAVWVLAHSVDPGSPPPQTAPTGLAAALALLEGALSADDLMQPAGAETVADRLVSILVGTEESSDERLTLCILLSDIVRTSDPVEALGDLGLLDG